MAGSGRDWEGLMMILEHMAKLCDNLIYFNVLGIIII